MQRSFQILGTSKEKNSSHSGYTDPLEVGMSRLQFYLQVKITSAVSALLPSRSYSQKRRVEERKKERDELKVEEEEKKKKEDDDAVVAATSAAFPLSSSTSSKVEGTAAAGRLTFDTLRLSKAYSASTVEMAIASASREVVA